MSTNCISGNIPQIWRLSGVTRTIRCVINDAEGEPRDLSDLTLAVVVSRDNSDFRFSPAFVVEGDDHNVVAFSWPADKQGVGDYTIEVTGVDGSGNVDRVNWHGATGIRLVDYTNEVRGDCPAIMSDEPEIGLEGEYTMNGTGMSAYEEWLADGHEGTPHDFILWLRQPATDAAAAAEAQMVLIQGRADEDHTRAGNDHTRAESDHGTASSDHTRAEDDHRIAAADHSTATDDHTLAASDHGTAAEDHRVAGIDHGTAADDHTRAGQDHQTASDDHTQAGSDHTRAGEDHTRAGDDHQTASSDHTRAGEDHTQAGNDHTRAEADHGIAADDHTQAAADHTQAVSDHATWADKADTDGYYERMGVGTAKNLEGVVSQSAEIIYRKTGGSASVDSGLATMSSIKGNTLVWNQLIPIPGSSKSNTKNGVTFTDNRDGSYTVSTVAEGASAQTDFSIGGISQDDGAGLVGHKVLQKGCPSGGSASTFFLLGAGSVRDTGSGVISQAASTNVGWPKVRIMAGTIITTPIKFWPNFIDLTLMFGAGNEPTTVAEFEAMYPLPYYDYNAGEIVSNKATALETVGFNQWDEEIEIGQISQTDGQNTTGGSAMRTINYTHVFPGESYYLKAGSATDGGRVFYYAADKSYVGTDVWKPGTIKTMPSGVNYIRFQVATSVYGTTYNHDICINFSDPAKNGTYQPYEKHTLTLNIPTLTGKLNGEGTSVVIAPEGMAGQDGWEDLGIVENGYLTKIIKKTPREEVDFGNLTWSKTGAGNMFTQPAGMKVDTRGLKSSRYALGRSSTDKSMWASGNGFYVKDSSYTDAATFKTAMSGVKLIYELATPLVYVLDNPVYVGYVEDGGGTERRLPEDTASSVLAPLVCDVTYPMDAVGAIEKMPENYISKESMQAYLAARASLDNGTWTMTWDAAAGKYNFTFSPNA